MLETWLYRSVTRALLQYDWCSAVPCRYLVLALCADPYKVRVRILYVRSYVQAGLYGSIFLGRFARLQFYLREATTARGRAAYVLFTTWDSHNVKFPSV